MVLSRSTRRSTRPSPRSTSTATGAVRSGRRRCGSSLMMLASSLLSVYLFATLATASSPPPRILHERALSYPDQIKIRILSARSAAPRDGGSDDLERRRSSRLASSLVDPTLRWDDRFLLSFVAYNETVRLALRPSSSIVHPEGIRLVESHYEELTGERTTRERVLQRQEVKVYEGIVLPCGDDVERWVKEEEAGVVRDIGREGRGWAKIVVPSSSSDDEPNHPINFQGAYSIDNEAYTIHSTPRYLAMRDDEDPEPPKIRRKRGVFGHPPMVVVRERDTLSPGEHIQRLRKRGSQIPDPSVFGEAAFETESEPSSGCGHDDLPFNTDPNHPVLESALNQVVYGSITTPWMHGMFGLPSRSAPAGGSDFSVVDRGAIASSYPPPRRAIKRQSGGDISGGTGVSSNFINSIGSTQGCPRSRRVVFVGVAADCTYTAQFSSPAAAREQILNDFNAASTLYQSSFNVSLGIVELNVQTGSCPRTSAQVDSGNPWNVGCEEGGGPGLSLNDRLSVFSQWRGSKGGGDGAGLWHLLTNCSTGSEVGVAWLGQLCRVSAVTSNGQTTSGTGVTTLTRNTWQVIAHEIGHNFGAIHDCATGCTLSSACCPLTASSCNANAAYIMSPVSARNTTTFSPCSIGNICYALGNSLNTSCLRVPGASGNPAIISIQSCGNGILESGEECDPGGETDPCCDKSTCKFVSGAVCSSINSLCCNSCQLASNGTVCRAAVDPNCDIAETCSGTSAECPDDEYRRDGTSCGSNGLACATGVCTSRTQQCQNAGSSLSLNSACSRSANTGCSIACQDPSNPGQCVVLDQSFRDGTPCGYAGTCESGDCRAGSALDTAKGWYRDNLQISIPVTIVVGLLVLAIIYALLRCCFCRNRPMKPSKKRKGAASSKYVPNGNGNAHAAPLNYNNGYYPPPPPQAYNPNVGYGGPNGRWVDPRQYNGNYGR